MEQTHIIQFAAGNPIHLQRQAGSLSREITLACWSE
ncbi:MAG: hypothetical protein RLZZ398_2181 [Verrucomicrobiota bacterium]|jgi:hypothetical protein